METHNIKIENLINNLNSIIDAREVSFENLKEFENDTIKLISKINRTQALIEQFQEKINSDWTGKISKKITEIIKKIRFSVRNESGRGAIHRGHYFSRQAVSYDASYLESSHLLIDYLTEKLTGLENFEEIVKSLGKDKKYLQKIDYDISQSDDRRPFRSKPDVFQEDLKEIMLFILMIIAYKNL
jgi:hypothetical protein